MMNWELRSECICRLRERPPVEVFKQILFNNRVLFIVVLPARFIIKVKLIIMEKRSTKNRRLAG